MPIVFLKLLGWLTAHLPESLLRIFAAGAGDFIFFVLRSRRRIILSNLDHAFPDRSRAWQERIGRESCRRLVETGLLSLATPYLSRARLEAIVRASPELLAAFERHRADPGPTLICSPHIAYWEAQTAMPLVVPAPFPEFGIIYRPLDHAAADDWVRRSRERFGMKLLSRRDGFAHALQILRNSGFVGVLFDQNAGLQGALTTLFGRVCSTTELPGLMARKYRARVLGIFPRRHAFWRIEIGLQTIAVPSDSDAVTIGLNRWLEALLSNDENLCASWLWAHDRWRHQDIPTQRLRLESKRNLLPLELASLPGNALPRRTRLRIRMPNWLGDVVMVLPALRAIRAGRPDAEITLLAKSGFVPLLESWNVADHVVALPPSGAGYFAAIRKLGRPAPDLVLLFTQSFRGDLEARLVGSRQRFGIERPGRRRPLLTHRFEVPADFDETNRHILELWEQFLRHFGLTAPLDRSPLDPRASAPVAASPGLIGLIAGSENNPEKRWPVHHWRALIEQLPDSRFVLLGTPRDRPISQAVAAGFSAERVRDLTGRTSLPEFAAELRRCALLITNDTGGMHLANALGVPLIGLFGPTNPIRTGPVFRHPGLPAGGVVMLQAPGCPPTGGRPLEELPPPAVVAQATTLLDAGGTTAPKPSSTSPTPPRPIQ